MFLAVISLITAKALYRNVGKRSLACLMPEKGRGASRFDLGGTMQPCDDDITWRDLGEWHIPQWTSQCSWRHLDTHSCCCGLVECAA